MVFIIPQAVLAVSAVVLALICVRRLRARYMLTVAQRAGTGALAGLFVGALATPARLAAQELGGMPAQPGMDAPHMPKTR